MNKQQAIADVLADPPLMGKESKTKGYFRCDHCNPDANLFPESEIFWDDECDCFLCERCLSEEKEARDIREEEERNHHK